MSSSRNATLSGNNLIWFHRFESLGQDRAVIDRWIRYYNEERAHQSLGYGAQRAHPTLAA
ncbi:integrase core domain-containing protein [Halomonas salinarum]|uniref:integrase core domain-containing protein n=1 Tax=Halomonas salinarum TaxID=1158993 RepID=UPI003CC92089